MKASITIPVLLAFVSVGFAQPAMNSHVDPLPDLGAIRRFGSAAFRFRSQYAPNFAWAPDGKSIALSDGDGIRIWAFPEGRGVADLRVPLEADQQGDVRRICFSPSGKLIAAAVETSRAANRSWAGRQVSGRWSPASSVSRRSRPKSARSSRSRTTISSSSPPRRKESPSSIREQAGHPPETADGRRRLSPFVRRRPAGSISSSPLPTWRRSRRDRRAELRRRSHRDAVRSEGIPGGSRDRQDRRRSAGVRRIVLRRVPKRRDGREGRGAADR